MRPSSSVDQRSSVRSIQAQCSHAPSSCARTHHNKHERLGISGEEGYGMGKPWRSLSALCEVHLECIGRASH
jgi:hypothetical protein